MISNHLATFIEINLFCSLFNCTFTIKTFGLFDIFVNCRKLPSNKLSEMPVCIFNCAVDSLILFACQAVGAHIIFRVIVVRSLNQFASELRGLQMFHFFYLTPFMHNVVLKTCCPLVAIFYIPEISRPLNLAASWPAFCWRAPCLCSRSVTAPLHVQKSSGHQRSAAIGWRGTEPRRISPSQCGQASAAAFNLLLPATKRPSLPHHTS